MGLAVGSNLISIEVTAEDGSIGVYSVDVTRAGLVGGAAMVVRVDGFVLTCPSSSAASAAFIDCELRNTNAAAADWPVVAVFNSSLDQHPAGLTKFGTAHGGVRLDDSSAVALDSYNYGYAELLPRAATGDYRVYEYEKFDWSGQAARRSSRAVRVLLSYSQTLDQSQFFYIALAPSDYTGFSQLVVNRVPLMITAAVAAGPFLATTAPAASLAFTDEEYTLGSRASLWHSERNHDETLNYTGDSWPRRNQYFDVIGLNRSNVSDASLEFVVEDIREKSTYRFCSRDRHDDPWEFNPLDPDGCYDIGIGVHPSAGLLHVLIDGEYHNSHAIEQHFVADYVPQVVGLSVEDTGSGLRVYRDVVVLPPPEAANCDDYPHLDLERYNCLFLGPLHPQPPHTPPALVDGLPKLVQPDGNYRLVFRDEFDHCVGGIGELDERIWNHDGQECKTPGSSVSPCQHFADGHLFMTNGPDCTSGGKTFGEKRPDTSWDCRAFENCMPGLTTHGKMRFKYGYLETKFTIPNLSSYYDWANLAMVLGNVGRHRIHKHEQYGVTVDDYEDLTTTLSLEMDIYEYIAKDRRIISHQYLNWHPKYFDEALQPKTTDRFHSFCRNSGRIPQEQIYNLEDNTEGPGYCSSSFLNNTSVTVTLGVEWTPRGFRSFIKVDGIHSDLEVVQKEHIGIRILPVKSTNPDGTVNWGRGKGSNVTGAQRDEYFELLDPGDPDSVLEQLGVSHVPASLRLRAWTYIGSLQPGLELDYIRVFQPENNYADMEPIYQ